MIKKIKEFINVILLIMIGTLLTVLIVIVYDYILQLLKYGG